MPADPTTGPGFRIATWNVNRSGNAERIALLADEGVDLLCAQEVTRSAHDALLSCGLFAWGFFSLDHDRRHVADRGHSDRLGVAVYGRTDMTVRSSSIISDLARPEKFLAVQFGTDGWDRPITVASYHASPGDGKPESTLGVAHWLEFRDGPTILGLDANSPTVDHPDHSRSHFCWQQAPYTRYEPALIGPRPLRRHQLDDAVRVRLAEQPDEAAPLSDTGPLAVTHDRDKTHDRFAPSRFDSIWVSPEFAVGEVRHLWDHDTRRALGGSDHAMVTTHLAPAAPPPRRHRQTVIAHLREHHLIADRTPLRLNPECLPEGPDRVRLEAWIAADERCDATWNARHGKELTRAGGDGSHRAGDLARLICHEAGITFPSSPAGCHWWLEPTTGRTLAQISAGR